MSNVTSKDGTVIAFEQSGQGQPLILVDGALCHRTFGPMGELSALLAPHFTVFIYDRRGRGESGDTLPFAVEREIEDIDALIQAAGGSAFVYGTSSGAVLALEAAASGLNIPKLALFEPPLNDEENARHAFTDYTIQLKGLLAEGQRGEAAALFMSYVGTSADMVAGMRHAPVWAGFEAVAPTLAYDAAVMGDGAVPTKRAAAITAPTLAIAGGASPSFMHETAKTLAAAIPNARYRSLEGQTHQVDSKVLAPVLIEFFGS